MKKYYTRTIVITTIHSPSPTTLAFIHSPSWNVLIIGDKKTPHAEYEKLQEKYSHVTYMHPDEQEKKYKDLSDAIGWNKIQRRNIGFVEAYTEGSCIIASVDDDNYPYSSWGRNVHINTCTKVAIYSCQNNVFDPLSVTNNKHLWHRGFPLDYLKTKNNVIFEDYETMNIKVQADLWNGDPDIDAMLRITQAPYIQHNRPMEPWASRVMAPFDSQNVFIAADVLKWYCCIPYIGRYDDIWGAYIFQYHVPNSVIFCPPSVTQQRNDQNLIKNLEDEIFGYKWTTRFVNDIANYRKYLPEEANHFLDVYRSHFKS